MQTGSFEHFLLQAHERGVIDFHLRVVKTADGRTDFYIHPAQVSGDTADFEVAGNFLRRLKVGAGSDRPPDRPLLGSSA